MTTVLLLARDFIERLGNPLYGGAVNDEYGMRLAELLQAEGFEASLSREIQQLDDPSAFTSHGWLWLLQWARAKRLELRSDLLESLFAESASVFVRKAILDVAVTSQSTAVDWRRTDVREFPDRFLASVMSAAIARAQERSEGSVERVRPKSDKGESEPATAAPQGTLVALLQANKPLTLYAASTLLHHRWPGQTKLISYFWTLVDNLDPETSAEWITNVRPPGRERPPSV